MPGLVGYASYKKEMNKDIVRWMRNLLKHYDWYVEDQIFSDNLICASRTHLGVLKQGIQPFLIENGLYSWIEGEFYNQDELKARFDVDSGNDNELLLTIFKKTRNFEFLKYVDGYYVSVVYDKENKLIHLISDRYGFKPLYWGKINGTLVWSSELKGFLKYVDFEPVIDQVAVQQFFDIGYILENRSWFKGVELMPPAAVLSYDIEQSRINVKHYWSWSDIEQVAGKVNESDVISELGRLFNDSVKKRASNSEKVGVSLSGGLDSRAILAAIPNELNKIHAYTFGKKDCNDIAIAKLVAKKRGVMHHIYELNQNNWINPRVRNIWITDASYCILHMHGCEIIEKMKSYIDINMNGFAGDLVMGGSYLRYNNKDQYITESIVRNVLHLNVALPEQDEWYLIEKNDPYFINNRVRKFTNGGSRLCAKIIEQRKPFFDNGLIEMIYSLPDNIRYKSYIYKKVLNKFFPDFFNNIPWQKTGYPISYNQLYVDLLHLKDSVIRKLRRECDRFGFAYDDKKYYTNYFRWIQEEPARSFFYNILVNEHSLYPQYFNKMNVTHWLDMHMNHRRDFSEELCRALTFEIWLQQVYEGKYRDKNCEIL